MGNFSDDNTSETSAFLPGEAVAIRKERRWSSLFSRIAVLLLLISSLVINLAAVDVLRRAVSGKPEFGAEVSGFAPTLSPEIIKFSPQLDFYTLNYTSAEETRIVRQRWQDLLPKGGGNVHVPNWEQYKGLSEPWFDPNGVTLWKLSWAHQLHCLYYVMDAYDQVIRHGAILCSGDMTLEGRTVFDNTRGTDGFGHTHVCRNYHEMVQWAEKYRVEDDRFVIDFDAPI